MTTVHIRNLTSFLVFITIHVVFRLYSEVLVLGPGCSKCKETYRVVERVIAENHLDVKLSKIEDIAEMMSYNIMTTPAVVVDGTVKIKGHVPTADEVKKALGI